MAFCLSERSVEKETTWQGGKAAPSMTSWVQHETSRFSKPHRANQNAAVAVQWEFKQPPLPVKAQLQQRHLADSSALQGLSTRRGHSCHAESECESSCPIVYVCWSTVSLKGIKRKRYFNIPIFAPAETGDLLKRQSGGTIAKVNSDNTTPWPTMARQTLRDWGVEVLSGATLASPPQKTRRIFRWCRHVSNAVNYRVQLNKATTNRQVYLAKFAVFNMLSWFTQPTAEYPKTWHHDLMGDP